ncbi:hypothetical protein N7536_011434 [Penicillium majusculum]|nr:hypothetical protein N7536_011434 [Penicillium majusculum]
MKRAKKEQKSKGNGPHLASKMPRDKGWDQRWARPSSYGAPAVPISGGPAHGPLSQSIPADHGERV